MRSVCSASSDCARFLPVRRVQEIRDALIFVVFLLHGDRLTVYGLQAIQFAIFALYYEFDFFFTRISFLDPVHPMAMVIRLGFKLSIDRPPQEDARWHICCLTEPRCTAQE
jgi:hypothetical protein